MKKKFPSFWDKHRICIICKNDEEYQYLNYLSRLNIWNECYKIILINAYDDRNISALYQDYYQNGLNELILIFCSNKKTTYEQYKSLKQKINEFHGLDNIADEIVIYGNYCTMQFILKNYKGKKGYIQEEISCINFDNYQNRYSKVSKLEMNDCNEENKNFKIFFEHLRSDNIKWIKIINNQIEGGLK